MKWWFPNGIEQKEERYKNGNRNGQFWEYYDNGKIKCEGNYVNGMLDGVLKEYFQNGDPKLLREYKMGKVIREQVEFKKKSR